MIKLEIVDASLQVSINGSVILVAPKNLCAIDVLELYNAVPYIFIYNKYLGFSTITFNQPLANCENSSGTPFDVNTFIAFAETNLGFDASGTPSTIASTGGLITFDVPIVYNTATSPTALNITNDLTGAKIGVVQKIYSNKSVAPTVPSGWVKLAGDYTVSVLNIIYAEWSESSRVEYWIIQG
jgi:hypothetical protein